MIFKFLLKEHGSVGEKKSGFSLTLQTLQNPDQLLAMEGST